MWNKFVCAIKWAAPMVIMIVAVIQLADIPFPKWAAALLLIVSAILYTITLFAEKKKKSAE